MKRIGTVTAGALSAAAIFTQVAHAQEPVGLMDTIGDSAFWFQLLITLLAGAFGGVAYELLALEGNIEWPHRPIVDEIKNEMPHARNVSHLFDLGIFARVFVGALAAVATWLVLTPDTAFQLIAASLVAGSAGTSVMSSMQNRLEATLSIREAAEAQEKADQQAARVNSALAVLERMKHDMATAGTAESAFESATGAPLSAMDRRSSTTLEQLDQIQRLLSEAKGIHEAV